MRSAANAWLQKKGEIPKSSKRRAAITNYIFGTSYTAFVTINGIVLVPLYLQHISVGLYGAWLASGNIISLLSLLDSGIGIVLTQRLAGALGREDLKEYASVACTGGLIVTAVGLIVTAVGVLVSPSLPVWFKIQGDDSSALVHAVIFASIGAGLSTISQTLGALPQACQRTLGMGVINLLSLLCSLVTTIAALVMGLGIVALGLGFLVRAIVQLAGYLVLIIYHWSIIGAPLPKWSSSIAQSLASQAVPMLLARLTSAVGKNSEAAVSAVLISPVAAAVLAISGRLAWVSSMSVIMLDSSVFAGLSSVYSTGDTRKVADITVKLIRGSTVFLGLFLGLTLAFNGAVVSLWVGSNMYGGDLLSFLIVVATIITIKNNQLTSILQAMGLFKSTSYLEIVEGVLRLIFMLVFGYYWGIVGIVLGGLTIALITKSWLLPVMLRGKLGLQRSDVYPLFTGGALGATICLTEGILWQMIISMPASWLELAVQSAICSLIMIFSLMADAPVRRIAFGKLKAQLDTSFRNL